MVMTFLSLVRVRMYRKWGATLKKRWETRNQMIGSKPGDQKELRILHRALRCCRDGLVFAAELRHGKENDDELGLSKSKPVSSPAKGHSVTRYKNDESKPLDEEEKRLYQRVTAKLKYLAHDRLDLKYATSCLASAVSSPSIGDMRAAKRVGLYLRRAPVAWQGFLFFFLRKQSSAHPSILFCQLSKTWSHVCARVFLWIVCSSSCFPGKFRSSFGCIVRVCDNK